MKDFFVDISMIPWFGDLLFFFHSFLGRCGILRIYIRFLANDSIWDINREI